MVRFNVETGAATSFLFKETFVSRPVTDPNTLSLWVLRNILLSVKLFFIIIPQAKVEASDYLVSADTKFVCLESNYSKVLYPESLLCLLLSVCKVYLRANVLTFSSCLGRCGDIHSLPHIPSSIQKHSTSFS